MRITLCVSGIGQAVPFVSLPLYRQQRLSRSNYCLYHCRNYSLLWYFYTCIVYHNEKRLCSLKVASSLYFLLDSIWSSGSNSFDFFTMHFSILSLSFSRLYSIVYNAAPCFLEEEKSAELTNECR